MTLIAELAVMIAQIVGYGGRLVHDTTKPDGMPRKLLDVTRMIQLGWKPTHSLQQGIIKAYDDYRVMMNRR